MPTLKKKTIRKRYIPEWERKTDKISKCWKTIKRKNFTSSDYLSNRPILIGEGQTTSQPTLISDMLKILFKKKKKKTIDFLDIGTGSGVVCALVACYFRKNEINTIIGIDKFNSLINKAKKNVQKIKSKKVPIDKIKFQTIDIYDIFKNNTLHPKTFDYIYVGAEPKTPADIHLFKEMIPSLLNLGGYAIAPIQGFLHLCHNKQWKRLATPTRFVPLERKRIWRGGGDTKKQKQLIKDEYASRISFKCKVYRGCKYPAVTGRDYQIYRHHLFPDFKSANKLKKWLKSKCIIDVGSGLNSFIKNSFISKLSRKKIGIDHVGTDIVESKKSRKKYKQHVRFVKGDTSTLSLEKLSLHPNCSTNVVLINNFFYLWLTDPRKLATAYKNILSWLSKGSQIRVFPVYFGRYDAFSKNLKQFLHSKFHIKVLTPTIVTKDLYEWHPTYKRKIFIKSKSNKPEKKINHKLETQTLILTVK